MKSSAHLVLQKYVNQLWLAHGYPAHAMRATFIATASENRAELKDIQRTKEYVDPSTTQLYDRRRITAAKSAALVVEDGKMSEDGL